MCSVWHAIQSYVRGHNSVRQKHSAIAYRVRQVNFVESTVLANKIGVITAATPEQISPRATIKGVVASFALQGVRTAPAQQTVVSGTAIQVIATVTAIQNIVATLAIEAIVAAAAGNGVGGAETRYRLIRLGSHK